MRKQVSAKRSKKLFTGVGLRTQSLNTQSKPHRGGWRL